MLMEIRVSRIISDHDCTIQAPVTKTSDRISTVLGLVAAPASARAPRARPTPAAVNRTGGALSLSSPLISVKTRTCTQVPGIIPGCVYMTIVPRYTIRRSDAAVPYLLSLCPT